MSEVNNTGAWAKLLNQLNLPTLGVILFMTGGNWWETKAGNDYNAHEIARATREIHDLYPRLMDALNNQKALIEANTNQLKNQTQMLDNQRQAIELLERNQQEVRKALPHQ